MTFFIPKGRRTTGAARSDCRARRVTRQRNGKRALRMKTNGGNRRETEGNMDRTDRKLDKRSINTNEQKAQSGDEKPGKQRMAGRQIKNVRARRKRGGKGKKTR